MMLPVFFLCTMLLASAQHIQEDVDDQEEHYTDRTYLCEHNDPDMFQELEDCFLEEHEAVVIATHECAEEVYPASEGRTVDFVNAACIDNTLFKKFDDCYEKYAEDKAFQEVMEVPIEVKECYERVAEKYGMELDA